MSFRLLWAPAALAVAAALAAPAAEKPDWADNGLGSQALSPDYVDPDIPPLAVDRAGVRSGPKRLLFADTGLPRAVAWRDDAMLKAPMRLEAPGLAPAGDVRVEPVGRNGARAAATFSLDGLAGEVAAVCDFDFTLRYTITLAPVDGPVRLERLALVVPLNLAAGDEKLVMYYAEGPEKAESGVEAQRRRVYRTLKGGDDTRLAPGFCSLFWVGTTEWGLSFNFPSARDWEPAPGGEMVFDAATGELTFGLIGRAAILDAPRVFTFFLTPTPVRTMPRNWRAWNYGWRGSPEAAIPPEVNRLIYWSSTFRFEGPESFNNHWARDPDELARVAQADAGMTKAAYFIPQLVTPRIAWEDEDGEYYLLEDPWLDELARRHQRVPGAAGRDLDAPEDAVRFRSAEEYRARLGAGFIVRNRITPLHDNRDVIFVPELADHMLWGMRRFHALGVGGVYFDGINPQPNYAPGAAWTDPDGKKRPHHHFDELRALFKRARALVKANDPGEIIVAHQSGTRPGATLSLMDAIIPGETFFYWYQDEEKRDASPDGDFYYAHIVGDIDNLKGEFFHRQWGVPHILLPEVRGRDRKVFADARRGTRTMLAYTLHFDMLYFPTMCDVAEIYALYRHRDAYGMADTDAYAVDFTPYWENTSFAANDPAVAVSFYEHVKEHDPYREFDATRKYLVIASNLQFADAEFSLSLPAGLRRAAVREVQRGIDLAVEEGRVRHRLDAYDFALFEITGVKED